MTFGKLAAIVTAYPTCKIPGGILVSTLIASIVIILGVTEIFIPGNGSLNKWLVIVTLLNCQLHFYKNQLPYFCFF